MNSNTCTVDRVGPLRERMVRGEHARHGIARPDGRCDGDPLSVTLAPANGTARRGPTAVMRSDSYYEIGAVL